MKTRFDIYQAIIRNGLWTRDEIRAFEDQTIVADGTGDDDEGSSTPAP